MTGTSIIRIALCLLAGCSLALMRAAGGPVLAHGHHDDYSRSPEVSIRKVCEHYPFQRPQDKHRFMEGLRRAGVRES